MQTWGLVSGHWKGDVGSVSLIFQYAIKFPFLLYSEPIAVANGCSVVRTYTGHGINQLFHTAPNIPHYAKNKAIGTMKAGMVRKSCESNTDEG